MTDLAEAVKKDPWLEDAIDSLRAMNPLARADAAALLDIIWQWPDDQVHKLVESLETGVCFHNKNRCEFCRVGVR